MSSLNQLVSEMSHSIGDPNNYALRQTIRGAIIHTRNELIRHSMEQHGFVDSGLQQRYKVTLEKVLDRTYDEDTPEEDKTYVMKTKQRVPRPTRFTNNLPFMRVSNEGFKFSKEIPYIKETSARFRHRLPGMRGQCCYDYINDFIYVYPSEGKFMEQLEKDDHIIIEAVFEYPHVVDDEINGRTGFDIDDDNEWFIPEDMIGQLKDIIYKRDLIQTHRENDEVPNSVKTK